MDFERLRYCQVSLLITPFCAQESVAVHGQLELLSLDFAQVYVEGKIILGVIP